MIPIYLYPQVSGDPCKMIVAAAKGNFTSVGNA